MSNSDEVRRVRYFNGQLLEADDFTAEQEYHLQQRRLHNRELHTWGIVKGLDVTTVVHPDTKDVKEVVVTAGLAIDCAGREILIREHASFELADFDESKTICLVAEYRESVTDSAGRAVQSDGTRTSESGKIVLVPEKDADKDTQLILARVTRQGKTVNFPEEKRRLVGVKSESLRVTRLTLTTETRKKNADDVVVEARGDKCARLDGKLDVGGEITVAGKSVLKDDVSVGEDQAINLEKNGTIKAKKLIVDVVDGEACCTTDWFEVGTKEKWEIINPLGEIPSGFQMYCKPKDKKGKKYLLNAEAQIPVNIITGSSGEAGYLMTMTKDRFTFFTTDTSIVRFFKEENGDLVIDSADRCDFRFVFWKKKEHDKYGDKEATARYKK